MWILFSKEIFFFFYINFQRLQLFPDNMVLEQNKMLGTWQIWLHNVHGSIWFYFSDISRQDIYVFCSFSVNHTALLIIFVTALLESYTRMWRCAKEVMYVCGKKGTLDERRRSHKRSQILVTALRRKKNKWRTLLYTLVKEALERHSRRILEVVTILAPWTILCFADF